MKRIQVKATPVLDLIFEAEGERERHFKLNNQALSILDEEFNGSIKVLKEVEDKPFLAISKLLYAGLKWEDESLTIDYINSLVPLDMNFVTELMDFIMECLPQDDPNQTAGTVK